MKTRIIPATALLFACFTASAFAGERIMINPANPIDFTMRFYLHPAHLYVSSQAPHPFGEHPAILVKRSQAQLVDKVPGPALVSREVQPAKKVLSRTVPFNS